MTNEVAEQIAQQYQSTLRQMKRDKIDTDKAPPRIQRAMLSLHQHAQLYWMFERREDRLLTWDEWMKTDKKMWRKK